MIFIQASDGRDLDSIHSKFNDTFTSFKTAQLPRSIHPKPNDSSIHIQDGEQVDEENNKTTEEDQQL